MTASDQYRRFVTPAPAVKNPARKQGVFMGRGGMVLIRVHYVVAAGTGGAANRI